MILIATSNPHKVEELRAIFAAAGIEALGLAEVPPPVGGWREPEETGATFEKNAAIKALAYAEQSGRTCLADDSGLEVDALGGRPGVISSHYCTDGRNVGMTRPERDRLNNERVLRELQGVPWDQRSARFVCAMIAAGPRGTLASARAAFEGRIGLPDSAHLHVPRGRNGFGYDPLFLVAPTFDRTSAELAPEDKNRLSHRGAAARLMAEELRRLGPAIS